MKKLHSFLNEDLQVFLSVEKSDIDDLIIEVILEEAGKK